MEFEWDVDNEDHIARHQVETYEAEEALTDPKRIPAAAYSGPTGEPRLGVTGKTCDGRIITVIATVRDGRTRVVTAREASLSEKRRYRR